MKVKQFFLGVLISLIGLQLQAQEWANVAKFQKDNSKIISQNIPVQVVFMGNSITEGWPLADSTFFKTIGFVNRGIVGQTTPQMLLRFKQDVIALKPKVVVILAGTNDIAENTGPTSINEIYGHIESMATLAENAGIKVILCSVLPVYDYPWKPGLEPAEKIEALNELLVMLSIEKGYEYADYFSAMANEQKGLKKDLGNDGVHPNLKGYNIMKTIVLKALVKALMP